MKVQITAQAKEFNHRLNEAPSPPLPPRTPVFTCPPGPCGRVCVRGFYNYF